MRRRRSVKSPQPTETTDECAAALGDGGMPGDECLLLFPKMLNFLSFITARRSILEHLTPGLIYQRAWRESSALHQTAVQNIVRKRKPLHKFKDLSAGWSTFELETHIMAFSTSPSRSCRCAPRVTLIGRGFPQK